MAGRRNPPEDDDLGIVSRRRARKPPTDAAKPEIDTPSRYGRQVDLRREAHRLYDLGYSYREIGQTLDRTTATVRGWIETDLADYVVTPETAARLKRRQLRMIEVGYQRVSRIADEAVDPELALKAIDRLAKLWEREAKLAGLDTPVRVETSWAGGVSEADQEIAAAVAAAEAEVARREAELSKRPDVQ